MVCGSQVKLSVFWQYMKAVSPVLSLLIFFLYCCQNAAAIGANVWLSDWTNEPVVNGTQHNTAMRIGVYAALGLLQGEASRAPECLGEDSGGKNMAPVADGPELPPASYPSGGR